MGCSVWLRFLLTEPLFQKARGHFRSLHWKIQKVVVCCPLLKRISGSNSRIMQTPFVTIQRVTFGWDIWMVLVSCRACWAHRNARTRSSDLWVYITYTFLKASNDEQPGTCITQDNTLQASRKQHIAFMFIGNSQEAKVAVRWELALSVPCCQTHPRNGLTWSNHSLRPTTWGCIYSERLEPLQNNHQLFWLLRNKDHLAV